MALARPYRPHALHYLSDHDGHVAGARGHACPGRLPAALNHTRQPLRHVILLLLHSHDICGCMGVCQLQHEPSAEVCHVTAVLRRHVQDALHPQWLVLACALGHNPASLRCTFHPQFVDHCGEQVVLGQGKGAGNLAPDSFYADRDSGGLRFDWTLLLGYFRR